MVRSGRAPRARLLLAAGLVRVAWSSCAWCSGQMQTAQQSSDWHEAWDQFCSNSSEYSGTCSECDCCISTTTTTMTTTSISTGTSSQISTTSSSVTGTTTSTSLITGSATTTTETKTSTATASTATTTSSALTATTSSRTYSATQTTMTSSSTITASFTTSSFTASSTTTFTTTSRTSSVTESSVTSSSATTASLTTWSFTASSTTTFTTTSRTSSATESSVTSSSATTASLTTWSFTVSSTPTYTTTSRTSLTTTTGVSETSLTSSGITATTLTATLSSVSAASTPALALPSEPAAVQASTSMAMLLGGVAGSVAALLLGLVCLWRRVQARRNTGGPSFHESLVEILQRRESEISRELDEVAAPQLNANATLAQRSADAQVSDGFDEGQFKLFKSMVETLWKEKGRTLLDELIENLRQPKEQVNKGKRPSVISAKAQDSENLGIRRLAKQCDEDNKKHKKKLEENLKGDVNLKGELLATFNWVIYMMQDVDLDRLLGFKTPVLPKDVKAPAERHLWDRQLERRNNFYSIYRKENMDTDRNKQLFQVANRAARELFDRCASTESERERAEWRDKLQTWIKWFCFLAVSAEEMKLEKPLTVTRALTDLPEKLVKAFRSKKPGDRIFWAAASSTTDHAKMSNSHANSTLQQERNVTFQISGVNKAFPMMHLSAYPEEREWLLPPFSMLQVEKVEAEAVPLVVHCRYLGCELSDEVRKLVIEDFRFSSRALHKELKEVERHEEALRQERSDLRQKLSELKQLKHEVEDGCRVKVPGHWADNGRGSRPSPWMEADGATIQYLQEMLNFSFDEGSCFQEGGSPTRSLRVVKAFHLQSEQLFSQYVQKLEQIRFRRGRRRCDQVPGGQPRTACRRFIGNKMPVLRKDLNEAYLFLPGPAQNSDKFNDQMAALNDVLLQFQGGEHGDSQRLDRLRSLQFHEWVVEDELGQDIHIRWSRIDSHQHRAGSVTGNGRYSGLRIVDVDGEQRGAAVTGDVSGKDITFRLHEGPLRSSRVYKELSGKLSGKSDETSGTSTGPTGQVLGKFTGRRLQCAQSLTLGESWSDEGRLGCVLVCRVALGQVSDLRERDPADAEAVAAEAAYVGGGAASPSGSRRPSRASEAFTLSATSDTTRFRPVMTGESARRVSEASSDYFVARGRRFSALSWNAKAGKYLVGIPETPQDEQEASDDATNTTEHWNSQVRLDPASPWSRIFTVHCDEKELIFPVYPEYVIYHARDHVQPATITV